MEENKRGFPEAGFSERMAREQASIQRAAKLVRKHEELKQMYDERNKLLEEEREKKRQRELKKERKEARKRKQIMYELKRIEEEYNDARQEEIEREILLKEMLELEMQRAQEKELKVGQQESASKTASKKQKAVKGKSGVKEKHKSKEKLGKRNLITIEALRLAFDNPQVNEAVGREYDAFVKREDTYGAAYWKNIEYFEWDISSSISSSDDDGKRQERKEYRRKYPLSDQTRKFADKRTKMDKSLQEKELKNSLDSKFESLRTLKNEMMTTKHTYYCHKAERIKREKNRKKRLENVLRAEFKIDVKDLPKNSIVLDKYKRIHQEKDDLEIKRLEKHIEIITKLLREEKKKHNVTSNRAAIVKNRSGRGGAKSETNISINGIDIGEIDKVKEECTEVVDSPQDQNETVTNDTPADTNEKALTDEKQNEETVTSDAEKRQDKKGKQKSKSKEPREKKEKTDKKLKEKIGAKQKKKTKSKEKVVDLPPPPPPLKRERTTEENMTLELLKDFSKIEEIVKNYQSHFGLPISHLPTETDFNWKPKVVLFKGFRKDEEYSKKVQITNLRCKSRLACRFIHVEYDADFTDPLVLQVNMSEVQRVCPGLGFTFEIVFTPLESTSSFKANLIFVTERETGLHEFRIPVHCTVEASKVRISPNIISFPKSPCWSNGSYGIVLNKTVTIANTGKRPCSLSIKNSQDMADEKRPKDFPMDCKLNEIDYILEQMDLSEEGAEERCVEYLKNMFECKQSSDIHLHRLCTEDAACTVFNSSSRWNLVDPTWQAQDLEEVLVCKDIIEECVNNVFQTFKFNRKHFIHIPAESKTQLKLRFSATSDGVYEETFSFQFHDLDDESLVVDVEVPAQAETTALPVTMTPPLLDMRVSVADCATRHGVFQVRNAGKMPCTVASQIPSQLRNYVTASPAVLIVQPGVTLSFLVTFTPGWRINFDAAQFFNKNSVSSLRFPFVAHIKGTAYGKCPPLRTHVAAQVTSAFDLSLHPPSIDLGRVSTMETVTASLHLSNNTLVVHEYGFMNLPPSVMIQPGYGFGIINPGQIKSLQVLYTPSPTDIGGNKVGAPGLEGKDEFTIGVTTKACLGGVYKGNREKIVEQILAEKQCRMLSVNRFRSVSDSDKISPGGTSFNSRHSYDQSSTWSEFTEVNKVSTQRDAMHGFDSGDDDTRKHLNEILGDDVTDDQALLKKASEREITETAIQGQGNVGAIGVPESGSKSDFSMRNLFVADDIDNSILDRYENLLDVRMLKFEMRLKATVYDPLCELSSTKITLPATPCGSFSMAYIHLWGYNKGTAQDCYCGMLGNHKAPVFNAMFEFKSLTEELTFAPCRGTVESGGDVKIAIVFRPKLTEQQITIKAKEMKVDRILAKRRALEKAEKEREMQKGIKKDKGKEKKKSKLSKKETTTPKKISLILEDINTSADDFDSCDLFPAEKSLLQVMEPYCTSTTITCVVDISIPGTTLKRREYLKAVVVCPVVKPDLVLLLDCPRLQFGPVALGTRPKKKIKVLNISSSHIHVKTSPLNPIGPLFCPAPMAPLLETEHIMVLPVTFAPETQDEVDEYMEVSSGLTVAALVITGRGVNPVFSFSPDFLIYRFETKPGKKLDCRIVIDNKCEAPLPFKIELLSVRRGIVVKSDESVGKGDGKDKKKKASKKAKVQKYSLELTPEVHKEFHERFMDFESENKSELFVLLDLDSRGEVLVPSFEKKSFNIQFNPPKMSVQGDESHSKPAIEKKTDISVSVPAKKDKRDKNDKKGKSSPVASSVKDAKAGGKKGKPSPVSSLKDVPVGHTEPQKFVAQLRVILGDIVQVRDLFLIGTIKAGKGKKK